MHTLFLSPAHAHVHFLNLHVFTDHYYTCVHTQFNILYSIPSLMLPRAPHTQVSFFSSLMLTSPIFYRLQQRSTRETSSRKPWKKSLVSPVWPLWKEPSRQTTSLFSKSKSEWLKHVSKWFFVLFFIETQFSFQPTTHFRYLSIVQIKNNVPPRKVWRLYSVFQVATRSSTY